MLAYGMHQQPMDGARAPAESLVRAMGTFALAAAIVNARFVPLNSRNHYPLPHEPAWTKFIEELNAFLPPARAAPRIPGVPLSDGFTRRELQVLELIAQGIGNSAIGERLGIGEKTVRNNVSTILSKMAVHTRAEAIVQARNAGFGVEFGT